jgi:hypothetical protein
MITYTLKIYTSVNISRPKLEQLDFPGFMVETLGESEYETRYDGKKYYVLQYQYALFATESGEISIPKKRYQIAQIINNGPRSIFNIPGFNNTQARYLSSPEISLNILPAPKKRPAPYWLVAEDVQIQDNLSNQQTITQGEPLTRSIEVTALNTLSAHLPPLPEPDTSGIKIYQEQAELDNDLAGDKIRALRRENSAIVAVNTGTLTLPPITLHWWDSKNKKFRSSTLPERKLLVVPASQKDPAMPSINKVPESIQTPRPPSTPASPPSTIDSSELPPSWYLNVFVWLIISGVLFVLLIVSNGIWWYRYAGKISARSNNEEAKELSKQSMRVALKELKQACRQHNAVQARSSLIHWGQLQWPEHPCTSLQDLSARINQPAFDSIVKALDQSLYGSRSSWNGDALLAFTEQHIEKNNFQKKHEQEKHSLKGLYE